MKKAGTTVRIRPLYHSKQAFVNLWRNKTNSLGSIFIMAFAFAILGIVFTIVVNVNNIVIESQTDFQEIIVYLEDDLSNAYMQQTYDEIKSIVGVTGVQFVSKDKAFEDLKADWKEDAYLLEDITESPLPNSFVITLKDLSYTKSVVDIISGFKGIYKVKYYKDVVDKLILISEVIAQIGFAIILVLLVLCFFIIANTIVIAVNSRRVEINIMKFVGAKNFFIRMPFIIEGVIIGLISAAVSTVIVYFTYGYVVLNLSNQFKGYVAFLEAIPADNIIVDFAYLVAVLGIGVGMLGAITSTSKHLNV